MKRRKKNNKLDSTDRLLKSIEGEGSGIGEFIESINTRVASLERHPIVPTEIPSDFAGKELKGNDFEMVESAMLKYFVQAPHLTKPQ